MKYHIKRSTRKTLALEVDSSAKLIVRAPKNMPEALIIDFIQKKQKWIERSIHSMHERISIPPVTFASGESIWLHGRQYTISYSEQVAVVTCTDTNLFVPQTYQADPKKYFYAWYIRQAKKYIIPRLHELAHACGYTIRGVRITAASKTRWGSCSSTNYINIAWRLIQAPLPVVDYVLIHELVHTIHKNHGVHFWKAVARHCPEYVVHKKWLTDHTELLRV